MLKSSHTKFATQLLGISMKQLKEDKVFYIYNMDPKYVLMFFLIYIIMQIIV